MNDEKKEIILLLLAFAVALVWIGYVITHPTNYTELSVRERIMIEEIIFR